MKRFSAAAVIPALLITSACVRQGETHDIYAPIQAGLTLQYENPQLEDQERIQSRYQIRVKHITKASNGMEVSASVASYQMVFGLDYLCLRDGGVFLVSDDSGKTAIALPSGFPYATTSWQTAGINYRVIGRANADIPDIDLPSPIGVWVEATPVSHASSSPEGVPTRTLFLPGIGEAETRVLTKGSWITVNRLVGRGFSDVL